MRSARRRGEDVRLRSVTRGDGPALDQVVAGMSAESRRRRYFGEVDRLHPNVRAALLDVDGHRHVALVAEVGPRRAPLAVGLARYVVDAPARAEVAYEVVDRWQGRGIGSCLLRRLAERAERQGIEVLHGSVLAENTASLALLRRVLFDVEVRQLGDVLAFEAHVRPVPWDAFDLAEVLSAA